MTLKGFAKFAAAALLTATLAVPAYADLKVSGDIDIDHSITNKDTGASTNNKTNEYGTKSAGTIRLKDRKESGDNFVEAQIEIEFNTDANRTDMEEVYMTLGNKDMNLQVGNFEKLDTYIPGQDEFVAEANGSGADTDIEGMIGDGYVFGRAKGMGTDLAFHYTGVENVTAELGMQFGTATDASGDMNVLAYRPAVSAKVADVVTINASYATYKAEAQNGDLKQEQTKSSMGLNVVYSQDNIEAGVNYVTGKENSKDGAGNKTYKDDLTKTTMSAFATIKEVGPGSVGVNYSTWTNEAKKTTKKEKVDGTMWFASYIMPIMGVEGTTMSLGYSQATSKSDATGAKEGKASTMGIALDYRF